MTTDNGPCVIVTFHTTAEAMATEKICRKNEIEGRLISVPRNLSADCGIAWKGPKKTRKRLEEALETNRIEFDGVYEMVF
ncbi:MAG TPA: phytoene dehydrogenase [Lachnospiraceae bacterium]|nr:phytoene dehydrogenase [Lachnospiraceae bacterium]